MKKLLLLLFFIIPSIIYSQEKNGEDIKVGLVLSGGGAKGLAHIGALKVIEESGVRIDYIGGTSMGAIIGALYASGYSAKQLDSIFRQTDFSTLIQDDIPRSAKTFYEKQEAEKYALVLPFDKFKIGFPSGLSKGQNVYNLLSKLTSHVSAVSDFSELPIPFFCVATNVENGKEVILDHGYLPRAVIASGALPSLFSPVVIDDKVLIDGGVVNNYPVNEVREKGMDIIIGVDVQDSLKSRDNLKSAFEVLVQINNYRTINAMIEKRKKTDIYIHPNINDFSVVSFDEGNKIVASGVTAAEKFRKELESVAMRQQTFEKKEIKFEARDTIFIKEVKIEGNEKYTRSYVLGKLKLRTPDKITYKYFSEGINNLSATGNFQDINYRFFEDENNQNILLLQLRESNSSMMLRFAAHYDNLFRTAALVNVTKKRLFTNNDIASLDLIAGDNLRYNFEYYIDKGFYWSVGFNSKYHFFETDVPLDFVDVDLDAVVSLPINNLSIKYSDFTNQLYFETLFRRVFIFGVGGEHKYLRYLSETIGTDDNNLPRTIFESTNYYSVFGFLKYDNYDNSFFPKRGLYFAGDFHWYLFAHGKNKNFEPFSLAKAKMGFAHTFFENFSGHLTAEGGFKLGGPETTSLDFALGGYGFKEMNNIIPFLGYEAVSLRGNTYLKSTLTFDYEIFRKNHINISANIANIGNDLFETGQWIERVDYSGFSAGYGLETILGPMEIKYSYSPDLGKSEWYVALGYRF
ncbi:MULTISPECIES: patatin-like phospholipase family protein [Aequorivita]|uniref:Patatin-like phospholipase family protein n=1 Tax=Aequorivita iocasae TaxID=2803865 RepID=A0ABX7DXF2_9FLAO|nr:MULTISPECIES: patatin-like phospholipase family protein [Aequorivita]QQX77449.1 patatin-like phospholipase family protein [Aequorivita iocasae]UCA56940.1 patatin-like phospholipase family protein [Aequorivita sp. F7]